MERLRKPSRALVVSKSQTLAAIASAKSLHRNPEDETSESNDATLSTLFPNKVFHPWYKRYEPVLKEDEKKNRQPMREIHKRNEEIALRHQYGMEYINDPDNACWTADIRGYAMLKYAKFRHKCEQRELEQTTMVAEHLARAPVEDSVPSVSKILEARKKVTDIRLYKDSKILTPEEKAVANVIISYIKNLRKNAVIEEYKQRLIMKGWNSKQSKWGILREENAKVFFKKEYANLHKEDLRGKFKRTIRLVHAAMRFLNSVGELSGDTMTFFKETFTMQEKLKEDINNKQKFLFDPNKFRISNETMLDSAILYTLTLPYYNRTEEEVNHVIRGLQVLRSFAALPQNTQKYVATVAWYIKIPENKMVIRQCHESKNAYILLSGKVIKNIFEGDPVDYGEDENQKGGFRVLQNLSKDSMFGEEALQKPGSIRTYSVLTGNVKCEALSISVDDYWEITINPPIVDFKLQAPEIILFLSNCDFLATFPKGRLIDEAENNVFVAYFPPGSAVEKSTKDSSWVYVVKHGTCKSMIEIKPLPELTRAYEDNRILSGEDEPDLDMLLPSRMVPVLDVLAKKEDNLDMSTKRKRSSVFLSTGRQTGIDIINKITKQVKSNEDLNLVNAGIAEEILEVRRKTDNLKRHLNRIKQRKKEKEEEIRLAKEEEEARLKAEKEKLDRLKIVVPVTISEPDKSLESDQWFDVDSVCSNPPLPVESKVSFRTLSKMCTMGLKPPETRRKTLSFDLGDLRQQQETIDCETHLDGKHKGKGKGKYLPSPDRSPGTSHVSLVDVLKTNSSCNPIPDTVVDEGKPRWSTWKLKKQMVKGDQGGFEWVNLLDGNYREPDEDYSIVSNGAELVMIRKEFILKHMRNKPKEVAVKKDSTSIDAVDSSTS